MIWSLTRYVDCQYIELGVRKVNKSYLDYLALRNVPLSVSDAIAFVTFVLWSLLQAPRPSTNELLNCCLQCKLSSFYRYANIVVTIKAAFLNRSVNSMSKKARGRGYSLLWAECLSANGSYKRKGNNGELGGPLKLPRVKLKSRKLSDWVYIFSRLKTAHNRCNGLKL